MTTYSTFDTTTDLYETDTVDTATSCCCGPVDTGLALSDPYVDTYVDTYVETYSAPYVETYLDGSDPVDVWTETEVPVATPSEPSSVIPAGQPGGPQAFTAAPSEGLYPSMATIGGSGDGFVIEAGGGYQPNMSVIGGVDFGSPTIVTSDGTPYVGPASMTIGPPAADSMAVNLANLYGMAAAQGDIMSQILITKTIDSANLSTLIWTL